MVLNKTDLVKLYNLLAHINCLSHFHLFVISFLQ